MKRNLVRKAVLPLSLLLLTTSIACANPDKVDENGAKSGVEKEELYPEKKMFSDVGEDDWYYDVIGKMKDTKVINGFPDESFKPDDPISREDAMSILYRYLRFSERVKPTQDIEVLSRCTDGSDVSEYAKDALNYLIHTDGVKGFPDGSLKPQSNITRADATILLTPFAGEWVTTEEYIDRFKDMFYFGDGERHYADSAVQYALHIDIIRGRTEDMFYPDEPITRAEFVKLLDNVSEKYQESIDMD